MDTRRDETPRKKKRSLKDDRNAWDADSTPNYAGRGPKNYQRSDARLSEDLNEILMWDEEVDALNIEIDVKDAVVTLKGSVSTRKMRRKAEEAAEEVPGVKDIHNELRIEPDHYSESLIKEH